LLSEVGKVVFLEIIYLAKDGVHLIQLFFVKKKNYRLGGLYNQNLGNSADIELMHRFLQKKQFKSYFVNKVLVVMRYGGVSNNSIKNILQQNLNTLKFLKIMNNPILILTFFISKIYLRINQIIFRT
jgi:uncharacterized membrane protein